MWKIIKRLLTSGKRKGKKTTAKTGSGRKTSKEEEKIKEGLRDLGYLS